MAALISASADAAESFVASHTLHGSLTNFSFPTGLNVFTSNVRISVTPAVSTVTTTRSPATPVETIRAPFGRVAVISVSAAGLPSLR
jgi:hypothetical protein